MIDSQRPADLLQQRINDRTAVVGVIGLGYVGLPLALAFAESGFGVLGFDIDPAKPESIAAASSYLKHIGDERVAAATRSRRLAATTDFARLAEPDALLICVPTPLTAQREPDVSFIVSTCDAVVATLRGGQLVVLESTTYPGTTEELVRGILDRSGLRCGEDYFLGFAPEREDPGNPDYGTRNIPKVVGGVDPVSGDLAEALYGAVVERTVRVSSARAAEATKLLENIFRAVNIALVNELKIVYDRMDIDVWEVLGAAATKPFGFMRFEPGPGWGGHCIPIDPFYLSWKARSHGVVPRFIELAGEVNVHMPEYVLGKLAAALDANGKSIRGSKVLLVGLAYKRDVADTRESPALEFVDLLTERGAEVSFHDPHVPTIPLTRRHPELAGKPSLSLDEATLGTHDAVVILTDHSAVDYDLILRHARLIVDTRGVYRTVLPHIVRA